MAINKVVLEQVRASQEALTYSHNPKAPRLKKIQSDDWFLHKFNLRLKTIFSIDLLFSKIS